MLFPLLRLSILILGMCLLCRRFSKRKEIFVIEIRLDLEL